MGEASLLLLLGLVSLAYVQGCTFKENAKDLISVGYDTDGDDNTAVDKIEVKMVDRGKFVNLMEGCTNPRSKEINVEYRVKGAEGWEKGGKKSLTSKRPLNLENLNPCETYEVKVAYVDEPLYIFDVGPFYNEEHSQLYLHNEHENQHYERYSQNPFDHIEIVSEESSAKILVTGFCARTIVLEVQPEGEAEEPTQLLLQNDLKNPSKLETALPDLKPCTKYQIILDLYLNQKATLDDAAQSNEVDYVDQDFAAFYTMPTMDGLDKLSSFDSETKTLSWDFKPFFEQDCANSEPTNIKDIKVTLMEGKGEEVMDLTGSKELISDCGAEFSLHVEYVKQENSWSRAMTVFNQFVSGIREATEESVIVENDFLALTVDPCLPDPDMVEFVPLTAVDQAATIQLTPGELRSSKLVSEVGWMGCLDYEVRIHRSGEVKDLNQLSHPGWKTALDGITLDVLTSTNDSVELQKPAIFWEDRAIKMEVACNGSLAEGEFDTVEFDFEVDEPLELTGLMSNTEYECAAILFKDDGSSSEWSEVWSAVTRETGEEPETIPEETSTMIETQAHILPDALQEELTQLELDSIDNPIPRFSEDSAADELKTAEAQAAPMAAAPTSSTMAPVTTTLASSGNLNFGSFLAVTLVSTALLLTTTGPF